MLRFLWKAAANHRVKPWNSPYLRWRMETYWGIHADEINQRQFLKFVWERKQELWRFLRWSSEMRRLSASGG